MSLRAIRRYGRVAGVRGLASAAKGKITRTPALLRIDRPEIRFPLYLRIPSTDVRAFEQIFIKGEYDFEVRKPPLTIVDAGANIGLATIYFSNRFTDAKIIAHENTTINLVDPDSGHWGFMTQARRGNGESLGDFVHEVQGLTVDTIMAEHRIDHIDVLKVDIEGAEREVFSDPSAWIDKVDTLIVELHERLKLGCNRSFYNSTNGFDDEWVQGENVYLARNSGCVARRGA